MTRQVRVVTDSTTMIPAALVAARDITVVPLTVTIGGDELVEDASLDVRAAYQRLRAGEPATTSAPSPGTFQMAYETLGPGPVVSVHIGGAYSGTVDAARLGARLGVVDVTVVDTGTASFLAGCCVLAAAEAAQGGADVASVVEVAEHTALSVASIFTLAELERVRAGGRLTVDNDAGDGVPILLMNRDGIVTLGSAVTADDAAAVMLEHLEAFPSRLRLGVGDADAGAVVDELVAQLRRRRPADDIIRYVVGPSIAAHAGMGTFGVVYHPLDDPSS
jgi:DegV family protein with EDD domain